MFLKSTISFKLKQVLKQILKLKPIEIYFKKLDSVFDMKIYQSKKQLSNKKLLFPNKII